MRRVARNGVIAVAAASGAMAVTIPAYAGSAADGSAAGSPGLISGNTLQLPVHLPVNACGNTVNVAGLLNPAAGNACANRGSARTVATGTAGTSSPSGTSSTSGTSGTSGGYGTSSTSGTSGTFATSGVTGAHASGGAHAHGAAVGSPGVVSGNGLQLPVDLPVNASGNSVTAVGVGNPAFGNTSTNTSVDEADEPDQPVESAEPVEPVSPPPARTVVPPKEQQVPGLAPHTGEETVPSLARTGSDQTLPALAGSAALLLGGVALHRRFRPQRQR
ncbi:chaplin [Streptomyces sp. NPDC001443]